MPTWALAGPFLLLWDLQALLLHQEFPFLWLGRNIHPRSLRALFQERLQFLTPLLHAPHFHFSDQASELPQCIRSWPLSVWLCPPVHICSTSIPAAPPTCLQGSPANRFPKSSSGSLVPPLGACPNTHAPPQSLTQRVGELAHLTGSRVAAAAAVGRGITLLV